jgi:hypothetical protein
MQQLSLQTAPRSAENPASRRAHSASTNGDGVLNHRTVRLRLGMIRELTGLDVAGDVVGDALRLARHPAIPSGFVAKPR